MKEISNSARDKKEATCGTTSCSYFLFFAPTLRRPLFQLSSSLRFSPLLACPPIFSISLYLYLHSHMRLRPKSSLLKPTWPKSKHSQLHVLVNKSRGPCQTSKAHLYISHANLSMNHLTGSIPKNIGKMQWLETLDLSNNRIFGPIPGSMSSLNFLTHLNLSFNKLTGKIPSGSQLQTLNDATIYKGNPLLCGSPLPIKCPGDEHLMAQVLPVLMTN